MRLHITSEKWFLATGDRLNEHLWAKLSQSHSKIPKRQKRQKDAFFMLILTLCNFIYFISLGTNVMFKAGFSRHHGKESLTSSISKCEIVSFILLVKNSN